MIQQLYHVGQHGDADNSFAPNWSPSGLPSYHDADGSHAMTEAEIEELLDGFVRAAVRAQRAGFDGVELFAAYHAVIDQFWTPWSNRRTDRWGGSLREPDAVLATLLERIRGACGDDFIVGLAVNVDPESAPLAAPRGAAGDRGLARRAGSDGLRHLRHGQLLRLLQAHAHLAVPGPPRRAVRRGAQGGHQPRRWSRRRATSARRRRPRRCSPPATPTWCRSCAARSPTRTWWPRPARAGHGRGAPVHLLQPAVLGPALAGLLDLLPGQPLGRTGARVGRRPLRAGRPAQAGARRRWRAGRPGGGAGRGRARPPCHPARGRRASSAASGGWRGASRRARRCSTTWPGTSASWTVSTSTCALGNADGRRPGRGGRRRRDRGRPQGHARPEPASSGLSPWSTACPASTSPDVAGVEDVLARRGRPARTGAAARRPRRLERHRHRPVPPGVRLPGHARHLRAAVASRAVPQRRRRPGPAALRPGRRRRPPPTPPWRPGPRAGGAPLDAHRRGADRHLRLVGGGGDTDAPRRAQHRARHGRHRAPPHRRLRGRPPGQPGHLRGSPLALAL